MGHPLPKGEGRGEGKENIARRNTNVLDLSCGRIRSGSYRALSHSRFSYLRLRPRSLIQHGRAANCEMSRRDHPGSAALQCDCFGAIDPDPTVDRGQIDRWAALAEFVVQ